MSGNRDSAATERPGRRHPRLLVVLVAVQLAALLVVGVATVARFHVFAEIDELAHFAFVNEVADHGRLPVLGRDLVDAEDLAAALGGLPPGGTRPEPPATQLARQQYEAFQPPLYYLVAAPASAVASSPRGKVFAVRGFDLALLLVAVGLLAVLARAVFARRWLLPFSLGLSVLLWPGVLVRAITVSNAALELPLTLAFLLACWHAHTRRSERWLLAAGGLLGLCLLTKLTLAPLGLLLAGAAIPFLRARRIPAAVGALAAPALLLAPWLASNLHRYDHLTAGALAKRIQAPLLDPGQPAYGFADITSRLDRLLSAMVPQEFDGELGRPVLGLLIKLLPLTFVAVALAAAFLRPRLLRGPEAALLGLPLALLLGLLVWILVVEDWQSSFLIRYANPAMAPFALFAAWAWRETGRSDRLTTGLAIAASGVVLATWVVLAGSYYFTDAGAALGIRAHG